MEKEIKVPEMWIKTLLAHTTVVKEQMDNLPPEDWNVLAKTDISALIGYAGSAKSMLNN